MEIGGWRLENGDWRLEVSERSHNLKVLRGGWGITVNEWGNE